MTASGAMDGPKGEASTSKATVSDLFEAHVGPVRQGLVRLLDTADELGRKWRGLPDAGSRGMSEIASQRQYAAPSPWGDDPVEQAYWAGELLLLACADTARSACRLLEGDPTPVYAHVALARSALEHAGRAWWLLDPEITVRQRIARGSASEPGHPAPVAGSSAMSMRLLTFALQARAMISSTAARSPSGIASKAGRA